MRKLLLSLTVLVVLSSPIEAAGPSIVMFFGEPLAKPVFVTVKNGDDANKWSFLQCGAAGIPGDLANRPFVKVAAFWDMHRWAPMLADPSLLPQLGPASASMHHRLYLPTANAPYVVLVSTGLGPSNNDPFPVPQALSAFWSSCVLSQANVEALRQAGVAGV